MTDGFASCVRGLSPSVTSATSSGTRSPCALKKCNASNRLEIGAGDQRGWTIIPVQERLQGRLYAGRGIIRQQIVRAKGKAGDVDGPV